MIKNFRIEIRRFGFEPEVTAKIARLRLRPFECPISYYPRPRIDRKKISWRDGVAAVWRIIRFNLLVSDGDCFTDELPARYVHAPGMARQTLIGRDSVA